MTPADYLADARRTVNPALSPRDRLWESAVGMVSESCELLVATSQVERIDELGDVCWYLASLCIVADYPFTPIWMVPHPKLPSRAMASNSILPAAGKLADHIKKHLAQGHPLDLDAYLYPLTSAILGDAWRLNRDIGQIFAANVAKRARRYPDGFTSAASVGRKEI